MSRTSSDAHPHGPSVSPGARRVERLRVYPLKSAGGIDVSSLEFDAMGPRWDRRWMVVRPDGSFVTQRERKRLARIDVRIEDDRVVLDAPGLEPLALVPGEVGDPLPVRVWDSHVEARACTREADEWISSWLGEPMRIAHMAPSSHRSANPEYAPGTAVSFADGYPLLFVSEASVTELGRRVGRHVPVERFRPNAIVEAPTAHEEDSWARFEIGGREFRGVKLCIRCQVTTVEQGEGTIDPEGEPLRTLATYRRRGSGVWFGVNVVGPSEGSIRVGDPIQVTAFGEIPAP